MLLFSYLLYHYYTIIWTGRSLMISFDYEEHNKLILFNNNKPRLDDKLTYRILLFSITSSPSFWIVS